VEEEIHVPEEMKRTEPTQEARAEAKFTLIMPSNKEENTAKRD
jgi:hypothetical protein